VDLSKRVGTTAATASDEPATAFGRNSAKKGETAAGNNNASGGAAATGNGADWLVLSIFAVERVPGSDDVFRRINNFKSESGTDKEWWKASNQSDRAVSPVPDDSGSSNEEGGPSGKRMRTEDNAD